MLFFLHFLIFHLILVVWEKLCEGCIYFGTKEWINCFFKLQQLKFYLKYTHNQLPSYFNNNSKTNNSTKYESFGIKMNSNVHSHNTRHKSNLHSEHTKT